MPDGSERSFCVRRVGQVREHVREIYAEGLARCEEEGLTLLRSDMTVDGEHVAITFWTLPAPPRVG